MSLNQSTILILRADMIIMSTTLDIFKLTPTIIMVVIELLHSFYNSIDFPNAVIFNNITTENNS